jgi:hypothetical protein
MQLMQVMQPPSRYWPRPWRMMAENNSLFSRCVYSDFPGSAVPTFCWPAKLQSMIDSMRFGGPYLCFEGQNAG